MYIYNDPNFVNGGLAQMVERALCMREVAGSIRASSKSRSVLLTKNIFKISFLFTLIPIEILCLNLPILP